MIKNRPLFKYGLIYGLIFASIPTLYNIILLLFGLHLDYDYYGENIGHSYEIARFSLLPIVLFVAVYNYKKNNGGFLKLGEVIKIGLWIALIGSIVIIIYNLIFRGLIAPDFAEKFYDLNRTQIFNELVEAGYTEADLERHERTHRNLLNSLSSVLFLNFFFALIFSLIIGLIMRKKAKI